MNVHTDISSAGKAFGRQSLAFDQIDAESEIIQQMRERVYRHVENFLEPGSHILELNAGTGIDACHFAAQGHQVLATDISEKMLAQAEAKIKKKDVGHLVKTKLCSFTDLDQLEIDEKFDLIFSDFGGLNCVDDFSKVGRHFEKILKPGGHVCLVMISPFCFWETSLALKGNFKLAFRRFAKNGAASQLEGVHFKTYYFRPSDLQKGMGKHFRLKRLEGLTVLAPPPYLEARFKNRNLLNRLFQIDDWLAKWPFFRLAGDHYMVTYQHWPFG